MKDEQMPTGQQIQFEESHQWSTLWHKLKNSIFDVLFVLLDNSDEQQESMFGLCFETGLDYLQMMAFPFNQVVVDVWNSSDTLNYFTNVLNVVNVSSYLPGVGFDTFLIMLYALIFLIIIVICDIVYVAYSFSQKRFKFTLPLVFLGKIVPLIVTVLFLPIMQTLLQVVNCETLQGSKYQVLQTYPDVKCWQGWHLLHTTVTLIFSVIFVFISCVVMMTLFEPRMTTNRLTARQNSTGEVIFILNKIVCQFIFSFSPFETSLPYCLMLFLLSAWMYSAYNINQPYYNKKTSVFFRVVSTYYFWTNLMLLVSQILSSQGFKDGLVIWSCGILFIGITIIFERKSNIDTLFSSNLKFKSGEELESHLQYVNHLHHNRNDDKNSYMLLLGYMEKHIELCLEQDCPLKDNHKKFMTGKQQEEYSCQQLLKQLERMFLYGIKKYPQCTKLQLSLAFFYMQKYNNSTKAYEYFCKALNNEPTFGEQFIIYRFKKIINEQMKENKQKEEDLIELIRFDNHVSLCEQGMIISNKLHKQFWIELKEEYPNLDRLNHLGARIIKTSELISDNYEETIKISNDGLGIIELQYNYALYLLFIAHETNEGQKLLETVRKKSETRKRKQQREQKGVATTKIQAILNTKKCLIVSCVEILQNGEYSYCRIDKVNRQCCEYLQYRQQELLNQKIQKVLPSIFEDFHSKKIKQWFQKSKFGQTQQNQMQQGQSHGSDKQQYIGQKLIGYFKQSNGFIKKVKYEVHFISLECKFITQFQSFSNNIMLGSIICNKQGQITEMTPNTILKFPFVLRNLKIEELFNIKIVERMRNQESLVNLKIDQRNSIYKSQVKTFECTFEKLSIKIQSEDQNFDFLQNGMIDFEKLQQRKSYLGIIVSFHEKPGISKQVTKQRRAKTMITIGDIETNRTIQTKTTFNKITNIIQESYATNQNQYSQESEDEVIEQNKINIHFDFSTVVDQEGNHSNIKTYRFFDGEFKRVYYDGFLEEQSDYDFQQKMEDFEAKLTKEKIQNENYQERIKTSIKTFIYHPEVIGLLIGGVIILAIFIFTNFLCSINLLKDGEQKKANFDQIASNIKDIQVISSSLSGALFSKSFSKSLFQELKEHNIGEVSVILEQNFFLKFSSESIDITSAFIWIQANLISYMQNNDNGSNFRSKFQRIYYFYLTSIRASLLQKYLPYNQVIEDSLNLTIGILFMMVLCSALFVALWIYIDIRIKHKIHQILIWFLDIPFDYINFAEKQCNNFEKKYYQSGNNGDLNDYEHFTDQYKRKQNLFAENEENNKKAQNNKSRQTLISRFRKKGILNLFTCSQLFKLLLIFAMIPIMVSIVWIEKSSNSETGLVFSSIQTYLREYIELQNLPMVLKIRMDKQSNNSQWSQFKANELMQAITSIKQNTQSKQLYHIFNKLLSYNSEFSSTYFKFQYSDLCNLTHLSQTQNCSSLASGKLQGGFSVFKTYAKSISQTTKTLELHQFQTVLRQFISPYFFNMLISVSKQTSVQLYQNKLQLTLFFYIYVVLVGFIFFVAWIAYLRRINTLINQTIKILNIIPIGLIPVWRKEVRDFLKWIILKSSQASLE